MVHQYGGTAIDRPKLGEKKFTERQYKSELYSQLAF